MSSLYIDKMSRMSRRMFSLISLSRGISSSAFSREKFVNKDVFVFYRNKICHTPLEAQLPPTQFMNMYDIQKRQLAIFIPHFTTGSILKVVWTEKASVSGLCQFTGICTFRNVGKAKVSSIFTLRNVVRNEAVNLSFELYSPIIQSIELIRYQQLIPEKIDLKDLEEYPLSASTIPLDLKQVLTDKPVVLTTWKTCPYLSNQELQEQVRQDNLKYVSSPEEVKLLNDPYYKWLNAEYLMNNLPGVAEKFFEINKPTEEDVERFRGIKVKLNSETVKA